MYLADAMIIAPVDAVGVGGDAVHAVGAPFRFENKVNKTKKLELKVGFKTHERVIQVYPTPVYTSTR
jgi:hypothetical protein